MMRRGEPGTALLAPRPSTVVHEPAPRGGTDPDRSLDDEIRGILQRREQAMLRGEINLVAQAYCDDAVILSLSGEQARGREAVDRYCPDTGRIKDWRLEDVSIEGAPDLWVQRARSTLTMETGDGLETSAVVAAHI